MKRITIVLPVLMIILLLVGCGIPQEVQDELNQLRSEQATWQKDQTELTKFRTEKGTWEEYQEELKQLRDERLTWQRDREKIDDQTNQIEELEAKVSKNQAQIEELEAEIDKNQAHIRVGDQNIKEKNLQLAELERENDELEKAIISLLEPLSLPQKEVIETIDTSQLLGVLKKYYTGCVTEISGSKFQLVSRQCVEEFLAADGTNSRPGYGEIQQDLCDILAFRLKDRWARAGFPPSALGLLKGYRITPGGRSGVHWRLVFITREGSALVVYEVVPKYDKLEKVEPYSAKTDRIVFSNFDPVG